MPASIGVGLEGDRYMATRDLSPPTWNSQGTARFSMNIILSAEGADPLPLDLWLNNYAPLVDGTMNLASTTFTNTGLLVNPDTTNARFCVIIPPFGNTNTLTLKGVTGDTGLLLNGNGPIVLTMPPSSAPSAIGLLASGAITGLRVLWF